jgi:DNA helicase-2/ATP-dependent DNA helicase PcrA
MQVFGDVQFWQRAEVKDVMAYLRLAANPTSDSFALGRIAGRPSRGLGELLL